MADAIVSAVSERLIGLMEEQTRYHINLVRGAEKEVRKLATELTNVRNVLDDAENRRFKDKSVKDWLARLEQTSYEMEDVLDEWKYAILKIKMEGTDQPHVAVVDGDVAPLANKVWSFIPSSPCLCFKKVVVRHHIAQKILDVKEQLDEVLREKDRYNFVWSQPKINPLPKSWRVQSSSSMDLKKIQGRDRDIEILVSKLTANRGSQDELGFHILSIVGVGGLGKTTLAQLVYNDSRVEKSFDLRIWVCVSDPFDLAAIAKGILESIRTGSSPNTDNLDVLLKNVRESILGKRFLLVLDDVWTEDDNLWEPLENSLRICCGTGSMILVTTRKEIVAKIVGSMDDDIHRLGVLSDDDCWLLLRQIALSGRNNMEFDGIGKKMVEKCKGLPLAAKTLGGVLRNKNTLESWMNVLNSEIWELEEAEVKLFPHLLLSYYELSPTLKCCFSYCSVFPKDYLIHVETLIGYWMALGYLGSEGDMEVIGQEYFDILAGHSLFQDFEKDNLEERIIKCKMHDIVHDFAQFLRKSSRVGATGTYKKTCGASDCSLLVSPHADEFRSLFWDDRVSLPNPCHCLTRLRVFRMNYSSKSLPEGMSNLIHLRWLRVLPTNISSREQKLKIIFQLYSLQTLRLNELSLEQIPREIGNLIHLRHLDLSLNCELEELPREIGNLIDLRHLDLSWNDSLKELPREIGKLIHLRYLGLSNNDSLKELPKEIGNLIDLRYLDLRMNKYLEVLPESIHDLRKLKTLDVSYCESLRILEGLRGLTSLRELGHFYGGCGWNKLGVLKDLNNLAGNLQLNIKLADDGSEQVVRDARAAELRNKVHIKELEMLFYDNMDEKEKSSPLWMDVIDALQPHRNLQYLGIINYEGPKLDVGWLVSPFNQVREVRLYSCNRLWSLPPLGKLPCLEELYIEYMDGLQFVGPEFLGITRGRAPSSSSVATVAFPKLKKLKFWKCLNWKEWEDIIPEEEDFVALLLMPCLVELEISSCIGLTELPLRLLRKALSLRVLSIDDSTGLQQRYKDKNGSTWKKDADASQLFS